MKLSLLILSVRGRLDRLPKLLDYLEDQAEEKPVQILCLYDNKKMTVGGKRRLLLENCSGEYFTFIDDDDWVSDNFVRRLLETIELAPDCIVYDRIYSYLETRRCCHDSLCESEELIGEVWRCPLSHTMTWKTDLVWNVPFPLQNVHEDVEWAKKARENIDIEKVVRVPDIFYHYNFNDQDTETHPRHKHSGRPRKRIKTTITQKRRRKGFTG